MKVIFVHDDPQLAVCKNIIPNVDAGQHVHVLTREQQVLSLYDIAIKVKNQTQVAPAIVFIEQYLICSDPDFCLLEDGAGIALVKFLRMLGVGSHIVLISPFAGETVRLIENDPGNLIVTSEGITLVKHLYDFKFKTLQELEALSTERADDKDSLAPYILTEFRLPEDERHNWANWWGVVQLTDVHRSMFPDELSFAGKHKYPADIDHRLKSLRSLQALYLFGHEVDFDSVLDELELRRLEKPKPRLVHEIQRLKQQIFGANPPQKKKPDYWFDYINAQNEQIAEYLRNRNTFSREGFDLAIKIALQAMAQGKVELAAKEKELEAIDRTIKELKSGKIRPIETFKEEMISYRFQGALKPRIIHVDDNATRGWSEIFQLMVYGELQASDHFRVFHETELEIADLYEAIKSGITAIDPHLVMLDLRLKSEQGTHRDAAKLSGAVILEKIREDFPGLPVMMTTASNKTWSYQALLDLGADAYWIKEGIDLSVGVDDQQRAGYSLENYRELLHNIFALCGEDYQFLKRFGNKVREMQDQQKIKNWWWKTYIGPQGRRKDGKKDARNATGYFSSSANFQGIFDMLLDGVQIFRRSLQQFGLHQHAPHRFIHEQRMFRSQVINRLAGIIEAVHFGGTDYFESGLIGKPNFNPTIVDGRKDHVGWLLYQFRNNASHFKAMVVCEQRHIHAFIAGLLAWLDQSQLELIEIDKIGKHALDKARKESWWRTAPNMDIVDYFEAELQGSGYEQRYTAILNPGP
jgi:CheY-like chemotaxis protein